MIKDLIIETEGYLLLLKEGTPLYNYLKTILILLEGIEKTNLN
jgi:hypothetical protein